MQRLITKVAMGFCIAVSISMLSNTAFSQAFITYPAQGQSAAQERQDRAECHDWAVRQSGYDPARGSGDPARSARRGTLLGGAVGGAIGSIGSVSGNFGSGLAIGAVAGGLIGAIGGSARDDRRYEAYLRAGKACMRARGYTIG